MTRGKRLGDVSADREPQEVKLRNAQRVDEVSRMVRHRLNGAGRFATRTRHPRIVKEDHRSVSSESVSDGGIPMVQAAAKVLHE
jgi:hypothetical protein